MKNKMGTLFDCIKTLGESDLNCVNNFVLGIDCINQQPVARPNCPHCGGSHILKNGHKDGKQRFFCKKYRWTFSYTTNTLMGNSHYGRSVWADFIRDILYGESLDKSAGKLGFSHQAAFNMRHKGAPVPESTGRGARKHGAKASKRGISNEYVAICTGIQRDGGVVAETVNRAKPSAEELKTVFQGHLAKDMIALTDGLRSYKILETLAVCTVVDTNETQDGGALNLNTVNSLHSFIKDTYNHYRGVATKYINRYNALFSVAFRCASSFRDSLFASLCTVGSESHWHSVRDVRNYLLVMI